MMFRDIIVKNCLDILLQINKTQLLVLSLIQLSCQSHNLAGFCLFYPKRTRTTGESISGQIFCIVESFVKEGDSLIYRINECRVQTARKNKGMPFHPCASPGFIEHDGFARVIDERIVTEMISCYPNVTDPECACCWKFTLR